MDGRTLDLPHDRDLYVTRRDEADEHTRYERTTERTPDGATVFRASTRG